MGLRLLEAGLDVGPVDDVPPLLDEGLLVVLLLQVGGVLPHVEHEQWDHAHGHVALVVEVLDESHSVEFLCVPLASECRLG